MVNLFLFARDQPVTWSWAKSNGGKSLTERSNETQVYKRRRRRVPPLLIQKAAFAAGSLAIFGTAASEGAFAKATQKAAGYQDTPKGEQRCDNCSQFEPPSGCKIVEGEISPSGWCKVYVKKHAGG